MKGKVKWFSIEKGYGFITGPAEIDYFFHVSKIQGEKLPANGDTVEFVPSEGEKGKRAYDIKILERMRTVGGKTFYGKEVCRTEVVEEGSSKLGTAVGLGFWGAFFGGPIGALIGAALGAALGEETETVRREVPITSPCIRCGGTGQVTSKVPGHTGFQCPSCNSFWKVPDHKLDPKEVSYLDWRFGNRKPGS